MLSIEHKYALWLKRSAILNIIVCVLNMVIPHNSYVRIICAILSMVLIFINYRKSTVINKFIKEQIASRLARKVYDKYLEMETLMKKYIIISKSMININIFMIIAIIYSSIVLK